MGWVVPQPPARHTGRKVAVVGSGPAGLACAQQLARAGHSVTVFEKNDRIGGLLRYGIPDFKMEKSHIDRRVEQMQAEGVVFRTGVSVGPVAQTGVTNLSRETVTPEALLAEFDAVVLAGGAETPRDLPVPGRELRGVHYAMEFLPQQNRVVAGETVPGQILATSSSHEEGCERDWAVTTKSFRDDGKGNVAALVAARVEWIRDPASGQMRMKEVPGSEFELPADLVLFAMGFTGPVGSVLDAFGVARDARGNARATTDGQGCYTTSVDRVFSAGDMRRGQSLVVWAIREGRQCARAVDEFLMGSSDLPR